MKIRALNQAGIDCFRDWLEDEVSAEAPLHLLTDPQTSAPLRGAHELEPKQFASLYDLGTYVHSALRDCDFNEVLLDTGVWNWLSLFFIDTLAPVQANGQRRMLATYSYLLTEGYRTYFRHLVRQSVVLVGMHGELARLFLTMVKGGIGLNAAAIELATRQDLVANRPLMEVAHLLYFDHQRKRLRRGTSTSARPGVIRRFAAVAQQLDLTYDLYSMSPDQIAGLLPRDFDRWKPKPKRRSHGLPQEPPPPPSPATGPLPPQLPP
jgi:hypothetical protein